MTPTFKIYRQMFDTPEYLNMKNMVRPVPSWLGNFNFTKFDMGLAKFSFDVQDVIDSMMSLHPEQEFNTVFWQIYKEGEFVKKHRDPKNNLGYTVIAVLGNEFEGGETTLYLDSGEVKFTLQPGDILSLPCTINGVQGPYHEVSVVTKGQRQVLILNTIEGVDISTQTEKSNSINDLFD